MVGGIIIIEKPSRNMIILIILSIIPLIYSLFFSMNNLVIFIGCFTLEFIIIGLTTTKILYPLDDLRQLTKKPIQIITLAIFVSLISILITKYTLGASTRNFIIIISIISIIITLFSNTRKTNINYSDNKIYKKIFSKGTHESIYAIAIYCLVSFVGINVPPFSIIPLWFGLCVPFILFLPGYLIINTLIPKKDEIELAERMGLSVFTSLIFMSVVGFAYAQINHDLNMRLVTLIILFITLLILIPAYLIKTRNLPLNVKFYNPTIEKLLVIMAIVSLILVILSGIYINTETITTPKGNTTFNIEGITETSNSEGYYTFSEGQEVELNISLANNEHQDMTYKILIESKNDTDNNTVDTLTQNLKDGESIKVPINITMSSGKKDITFTLYKNETQVYKIRHLYVDVGGDTSEETSE